RVTRRQKKARRTAVPFAWNVLRCLVREIEKEHDPRRAPMFICLPRQIPPTPAHRPGASGTPSRAVWAVPKPSAQGEFISPEQVQSSGQREKARPTSCLQPVEKPAPAIKPEQVFCLETKAETEKASK